MSVPRDRIGLGLCHGLAGIAFLLWRLGVRLGLPELRCAADDCYALLLAQRSAHSNGVQFGGFRFALERELPATDVQQATSFLYGASGVALALGTRAGKVGSEWEVLIGAS